MVTRVIVVTEDHNDSEHRDIAIVDDQAEAERLIETLLQAGTERRRIRVFAGSEMEVQVTQRPAVALLTKDDNAPEASDGWRAEEKVEEAEAGTEDQAEVAENSAPERGFLLR